MCRGSVYAETTEEAIPGVNYHIAETRHLGGNYRHGVLHREGHGYNRASRKPNASERVVRCAACIREPTRVQITGVPVQMATHFGIDQTFLALFIPGDDEADGIDKIELATGRRLDLSDFADQDIRLALVSVESLKQVPGEGAGATQRVLEAA